MGRHATKGKSADEQFLIDRVWDLQRVIDGARSEMDEIKEVLRDGKLGTHYGNTAKVTVFKVRKSKIKVRAHERTAYTGLRFTLNHARK